MSLFSELDAAFPNHTHFYEVVGLSMAEALDRCARMTGGVGQVFAFQGKTIFAVQHDLGNENDWLRPVDGSPADEASAEE